MLNVWMTEPCGSLAVKATVYACPIWLESGAKVNRLLMTLVPDTVENAAFAGKLLAASVMESPSASRATIHTLVV
ncbi:MAG: hypothetical protein BWX54_02337 [Verrucomicrobia bacterium ADurb.Bin018]|nr:MAG: hypothetical protein BWX54_02337 [Verrucomicrobia bacterium ADurb.Bin018]